MIQLESLPTLLFLFIGFFFLLQVGRIAIALEEMVHLIRVHLRRKNVWHMLVLHPLHIIMWGVWRARTYQ